MLWPQFVFANHLVLTYLLVSYPRKSGAIGNGNHLRPIHLNYELGPQLDHDGVAVLIFIRIHRFEVSTWLNHALNYCKSTTLPFW